MMNLRMVKVNKVNLKRGNNYLLITGDGRTLLNDLDLFLRYSIPHDVMSIGRSINVYPKAVKHWVNVDGSGSKWWAEHLPGNPIRHTLGECEGYNVIWDDGKSDGAPWYGSSALFATFIGLILGYKSILLAGCPMDNNGHWYFGEEWKGPDWREEDYQAWRSFSKLPEAKKVRSLSGFTKECLSI